MKRAARLANRIGDLAFLPPLDRWWRRRLRGRVACLVYHRVGDPAHLPYLERGGSPVIRPEQLERDLRLLVELGARFCTFADLRGGWFPARDEIGIIASFDDGFRSSYEAGIEVLERVGARAVFFQSTGLIAAERLIWEHALYWYTRDEATAGRFAAIVRAWKPDLAPVSIDGAGLAAHLRERIPGPEVERLLETVRAAFGDEAEETAEAARAYPGREALLRARDLGHEIGSHGHRHYKRDTIDDQTFEADLERSVAELADLLGRAPSVYSFPFDSHRPDDDAIVGRHFQQAATVDRRPIERDSEPLWLPRYAWPGHPRNALRQRRWLLTGRI